jgi:hypothetical protein
MFLGHFALGFGAKRLNPALSLGTLFVACQLADLIWPTLVLLGVEHVAIDPGNTAFTPLNFVFYPYSHSLAALLLWGVIFSGAYQVAYNATRWTGLLLAALVVSHWVLDFISHRPDMPLMIDNRQKVGLGLWNSVPATVAVESLMFAVGLYFYVRTTAARDRIGSIGLWSLVIFFIVINIANTLAPRRPVRAPSPGPPSCSGLSSRWRTGSTGTGIRLFDDPRWRDRIGRRWADAGQGLQDTPLRRADRQPHTGQTRGVLRDDRHSVGRFQ